MMAGLRILYADDLVIIKYVHPDTELDSIFKFDSVSKYM